MPIILFTLTGIDVKTNPYRQVGEIHNAGLTAMIAGFPTTDPSTAATNYIAATYSTYVTYAAQSIDPITSMGFNSVITPIILEPTNTLIDIDMKGNYNEWIQAVFSFVDNFPPVVAATTIDSSRLIFDFQTEFEQKAQELLNQILSCGLSPNENSLALIAHSVLTASYAYWRNVYTTGAGNPWYDYIVANIQGVGLINWRMLIQQDIKGALLGAIAYANNIDNKEGTLIIGAAGAAMAASGTNLLLQLRYISVYAPAD